MSHVPSVTDVDCFVTFPAKFCLLLHQTFTYCLAALLKQFTSVRAVWVTMLCTVQVPSHSAVFINEPRLSEFKQLVVSKGIQAEMSGGVLICNNVVAVRRVRCTVTVNVRQFILKFTLCYIQGDHYTGIVKFPDCSWHSYPCYIKHLIIIVTVTSTLL